MACVGTCVMAYTRGAEDLYMKSVLLSFYLFVSSGDDCGSPRFLRKYLLYTKIPCKASMLPCNNPASVHVNSDLNVVLTFPDIVSPRKA